MVLYLRGLILAIFLLLNASVPVFAQESKKVEIKRVGGIYVVKSITKKADNLFLIEFEAVAKNGKGDIVQLESEHVHVGVEEGHSLRISAEVASEKGAVVEASQVLLFLPKPEGAVPVWLLSKKGRGRDMNGSKYLEMHAPQSDYLIL